VACGRIAHRAAAGGIGVSLIAMAATLSPCWPGSAMSSADRSLAISTDHVHYQSDLLLNLAVIAALALDSMPGFPGPTRCSAWLSPLWLGWGAWGASQEAIFQLMDHEWPRKKRPPFSKCWPATPRLRGVHDLRTRTSGNRDFVQFHLAVNPDMTIREAHVVMDEVEAILQREFPGLEILIHPDPVGHVDDRGSRSPRPSRR
jgi:ferrous-iron efflux pump FieF